MTSSYDKVIHLLNESKVTFRIHEHLPVLTMNDVERNLPFPIEKLLKTLVFRIKESRWVYAVLKGRDRVDYKKLSKALEVSRSELIRPSPQDVEKELSLQLGGICPIPIQENITVILDAFTVGLGTVYCGVGSNDKSLEIDINDLARVSKANIHPIAQDSSG